MVNWVETKQCMLPLQKCDGPVLLASGIDLMVQSYLKKLRDGGGAMTARIVMAAARCVC